MLSQSGKSPIEIHTGSWMDRRICLSLSDQEKHSFWRLLPLLAWSMAFLLTIHQNRCSFVVSAVMIRSTRCLGGSYLHPHSLVDLFQRLKVGRTRLHASASIEDTTYTPSASSLGSSEMNVQHRLVIVESPAKCTTIEKILNEACRKDNSGPKIHYTVVSCMGHIRNLPNRLAVSAKRGGKLKPTQQQNDTDEVISKDVDASLFVSSSKRFPYAVAGIDLESGRYTPSYVIDSTKRGVVKDLKDAVQLADHVYLATDPDREGESMAWHLADVLQLEPAEVPTKLSPKKPYYRIRFSEITKQAILSAVESACNASMLIETESSGGSISARINDNLVAAQETRRILDRLAGYTVSPVLWRKIAPGLSAGRVQSVGLQMIVARERLRLAFQSTPYFDLKAELHLATPSLAQNVPRLITRLVSINGTAVANSGKDFTSKGQLISDSSKQKYHLASESDALYWVQLMNGKICSSEESNVSSVWVVDSVKESKRVTKSPLPYKTSTLQQEAGRRLGLPVQQTMRTAQVLYESGLISYMRTDSTSLSDEAHIAVESAIQSQFGSSMVETARPESLNQKAKFSQEAHEAIRPAIQPGGNFLTPEQLPQSVQGAAVELYRMIYQRTLAYRMPPLVTNQTQVIIRGTNGETEMLFRTSGRVILSPGFTLAYQTSPYEASSSDDDSDDENESPQELPPLSEGQLLRLLNLTVVDHETQPPPRYTEASFIKELEARGVGRPSTYASIVQILRDRAYIGSPVSATDQSRSSRGRVKTWTGSAISAMRAAGGRDFVGNGAARGPLVPSLSAFVVCSLLEKYCPTYVDPEFTACMENRLDRIASGDEIDTLSCDEQRIAYLDEFYAGENGLAAQISQIDETVQASDARRAIIPALDDDNESNKCVPVGLFIGPWGPYVQKLSSGDSENDNEKPFSVSLPPSMAADISTIKPSVLRSLLKTKQEGGLLLGQHPDDGRNIWLKTGKFGVFLQWGADKEEGTTTHSLPKKKASFRQVDCVEDVDGESIDSLGTMLGVTLEDAVAYCGLPRVVSSLMDKPIVAAIGPYGPYLKYDGKFLTLKPSDGDVLTIDAEAAESLVTNEIVNKPVKLGRGVIAVLGEKDGEKVTVKTGQFGHYVKWNKVNVQIPKDYLDRPEAIPFEEAWSLIADRLGPTQISKNLSKSNSKKKSSSGDVLPPRPKRPLSAYLHFCAARRPNVAESVKSLGEISKKLASLWAETSLDDRQVYERLATEGKRVYDDQIKAWEIHCNSLQNANIEGIGDSARLSQSGRSNSAKSRSLGKAATKEVFDDADPSSIAKRKSRSPSAYMIFCRENRKHMVDEATGEKLPFVETTQRLALLWRECDEATKNTYKEMAAVEKEKSVAQALEED